MKNINLIEMQQRLRKNTNQTGWLSRVICMLMVLFSLGVGQMLGTPTQTYNLTGYSSAIANGACVSIGGAYVGRKGSGVTPNSTYGVPTGGGNIAMVFVVSQSSTITMIVQNQQTSAKSGTMNLASVSNDFYTNCTNGTLGSMPGSADQTCTIEYAKDGSQNEEEFTFAANVSAGKYIIWTAATIASNIYIKRIEINAASSCGETAQAALTLSSNSGTICGTGTATFTVSGGSGTGALSVSSSDPSKATASIDGSTVTVTGVAAGSATITVTKACDATYAEKTATYSATVAAVPTANAGADKTTEPETGVALAATAAASGCTGAWTIESGPNTSSSQLSSSSSATATFTPTAAGTYTLRWTVTNTSTTCSAYDEMKVTAAICSISECGNATLTYPIYTGGDLTTSNLFSGASSTNATAVSVGSSPAFTGVTVSAASKGSSANAGACYAKGTALTGKMQYSTSSKSSSYYIDFPFTVNTGYTFTPCDVQVVIQPVSSNQAFTVEITNGTNVYGTTTATLNAGVMEPIIGLTSTAEMSAGNYAVRLYPHGGSSKEFRMGANVILKGTTASAAPSCTAPNHVDVTPTSEAGNYGWRYSIGETLKLTATPYSSAGTGSPITTGITGYQWQKYVTSDWVDLEDDSNISGATTANLQISNLATTNGGSYRCKISTGATCTTASDGYFVRIFTLYGGYSGGAYSHQKITWTGEKRGTVTIDLNASSSYKFKFTDNNNRWFGNGGTISSDFATEDDAVWGFGTSAGDATLSTGSYGGGNYVLTVDITHFDDGGDKYVNLRSTVYPKKTTYLQLCSDWKAASAKYAIYYYNGGTNDWTDFMTAFTCDGDILSAEVPVWATNAFFVRFDPAKTSTGDFSYEWKRSGDNESTLPTDGKDYYNSLSKGGNDQYYGSWATFSPTTYTISFDGNGETSGSMTDVEDIACDASVTLAANAFVKTGYTFAGWKDASSNDYANEATISNITANIALTAQWTAKQCTVTFDKEGGTGTISNVTATYDAAMPSKASNLPEKTGYTFGGFWDGDNGTGTKYYNANGTSAQNWDKNTTSTTTLYAKWTANTPTITLDDQDATNTPTGSVVATYGSAMPSIATLPTKTGYTFGGFYSDVAGGGTKYYNADGSSAKNSDLASAATLYALWTQTVTLHDNHGGSNNGSVSVTYKGTAGTPSAPTYAGHTPDLGYYAEAGCTNKVMALDGTLQTSVTDGSSVVWTNSSSKWAHAGASILYAHWKCNTPTITDNGNNTVTITIPSGTTVRYTTDGTDPSSSTGTVYSTTFSIAADCTVKAIAYQSGCTDSEVASAECDYTAPANFQMVANSSAASDATLELDEYIAQGSKNCVTLTGGTAQYQGASGKTMKVNASNGSGTSQYYGWYFNSSGDKIVVTMTSHIIQVGSVISVEGYGASGNGITANTSTSLLNSTGTQQQWSASHTVVAGDTHLVGKNVITFDRYNSCRIFSITISNCQSGTMCVMPVLPSLTTPNQACTTGDFAEWDASVTNSAAISAASGSQAVSYSWKNSSSVEVATTAAYTPTAAGTYTVTATVHSDEDGYIDASVTSSTLTASLYGNPSVTGPSDAEYVVGASASNLSVTATPTHGESLTYQWYSNTAKSTSSPTPTALENCTTSTYKPSTAAAATTYYFCKVSGGCEDVYSSIATVTVTEAPCLSAIITKSSGSYTVTSGTPKVITSDATITEGATITLVNNYGSDKTYSFSDDGVGISTSSGYVEITFPSGFYTAVGSVIRVTGKGGGTGEGLSLIDDNGDVVASGTGSGAIDFTYTIIAASTIKNKNHIRINRAKTSGTNIFKSVTVTGCDECTDFSPTLNYDKTTLWVNDGDIATPTLDKKTSTGSVTYSSSNTDIATVNENTGVVTAVAGGNVTITASIASDGTHCARTATCDLTIKQAACGWNEIANAVLTAKNSATTSNATALYQYMSNSSAPYKLDKTLPSYFGLRLSSGNFQVGDSIIFKVKIGDMDINGGSTYPVAFYHTTDTSSYTTSNLIYTSGAQTKGADNVYIRFAVTQAMKDAGLTNTILIIRSGRVKQNHSMYEVRIKRFTCTECLGFVPSSSSEDWNTLSNWYGSSGPAAALPTASDRVHIYKPATVDGVTALASEIILYTDEPNTGKLTIADDGVLKVAGTIQAYNNATSTKATTVNDVVIECSKTSQGALIFDQPSSGSLQTKGTVNFYTRSYRDGTSKKLQWQYVGYPFISGTDEDYDGYYINKYSETQGKWIVMRDQGDRSIAAWEGLAIAGDGEGGAQLQGTFAPTTNQSITLSKTTGKGGGENLVGNSWTAPIQLADMSASDFGDATATVYIFNTGRFKNDESEGAGIDTEGTTGHTVGQWMTIPISSAASGVWAGMKVIPAFQAFEVITSSATTLSLNYANHVRSASNTMNAELHAPARRGVKASEVDGYRIRVADSLTQTDMYLFEDISFTTGFDNGWEGYYMPCDGRSAQLYVQTTLGKMAVAALPDLEGTLLGFKPGKSSEYTFSFGTNAGGYYLNDLKTQTSTLIEEGETYTFTWENGDSVNRFMISATPFAGMPSGLDESFDKTDKVQKIIYNDHVYIIRGGKIYGVDGTTVK